MPANSLVPVSSRPYHQQEITSFFTTRKSASAPMHPQHRRNEKKQWTEGDTSLLRHVVGSPPVDWQAIKRDHFAERPFSAEQIHSKWRRIAKYDQAEEEADRQRDELSHCTDDCRARAVERGGNVDLVCTWCHLKRRKCAPDCVGRLHFPHGTTLPALIGTMMNLGVAVQLQHCGLVTEADCLALPQEAIGLIGKLRTRHVNNTSTQHYFAQLRQILSNRTPPIQIPFDPLLPDLPIVAELAQNTSQT